MLQKSKELPTGSQVLAADKSLERKQQHQQPLHQLQQQQQQREQQQPVRWREKEAELQHRLTEREREIGRLKEKLRDLTKKLRDQDDTKVNSAGCRNALWVDEIRRPVLPDGGKNQASGPSPLGCC